MSYFRTVFFCSLVNQFPYVYFVSILFFLAPFSLFISTQLLRLINTDILFYRYKLEVLNLSTVDDVFSLLNVLIRKKLWLESIQLLELMRSTLSPNICQYFNATGFIYYNMQKYNLAKFYYLEALKIRKDYIIALQNLARVYEALKDDDLACSTYDYVLKHDPDNKAAYRYYKMKKR